MQLWRHDKLGVCVLQCYTYQAGQETFVNRHELTHKNYDTTNKTI